MTFLHNLALFGLLILQMLHLLVMIISLFFLMRYYSGKKIMRSHFRSALAWGLISEPFAFVLYFISLKFATLSESIFYAISIILGLMPLALLVLHKD